ncbi:hypothetical protein JD969_10925 [Planctomycetota bacterium]|nr:hypothetical protein JD969_10925 [Planctomycetota bacterium]
MSQEEKTVSKWVFVLWGFIILMVIGVIGELHVLGTVLLAGMALTCMLMLALKNVRMKVLGIEVIPNAFKHGTKRWLIFVMLFSLLIMAMKIDERGVNRELKEANVAWNNGERQKAVMTYQQLLDGSKALLGMKRQKAITARLISYYHEVENDRLAKQYAEDAFKNKFELRFTDEKTAAFYDEFLDNKKAEANKAERMKDYASRSLDDAFAMAKVFIKQNLKSPKSASFGWQKAEDCTEKVNENGYVVQCYVDAKNPLGVEIRNHFKVTLMYVGEEQWMLVGIEHLK